MNLSDLGATLDTSTQAQAFLRSILATVPDALVVVDERGAILSFSPAAQRLFDYSPRDVIGQDVCMLFADPDRLAHSDFPTLGLSVKEGGTDGEGARMLARHKDGTAFYVALNVGDVVADRKRLFTLFMRLLTNPEKAEWKVRELQAELLHHSRVGVVGTMATALAHEINQPLASIANYVEAAVTMLGKDTDARVLDALQSAAQEAVRAGEIISHLRRFVSRGELQRTLTAPSELVHQTCALAAVVAKPRGIECHVDVGPSDPPVLVDAIQIQQVLLNLARNAIEALERTNRPGRIILKVRTLEGHVRFSVSDDGPGLPADLEVFTLFSSTKKYGMGLGLSICKTIIDAHGGQIWFEDCDPCGTAFHFTIPVVATGDHEV